MIWLHFNRWQQHNDVTRVWRDHREWWICDDNDIMRWPIVIAVIRSHVNYTEMMTDAGWSGVMMTMSVLTSVSWHHVTNVTWHQLRPRDMCLRLSPVTKLSISSIQMSSPPPRMPQCPLQWTAESGVNWIETRLAVDRVKPWLTKMIIIIIIIVSAQSKELGFWVF